MRLVLVGSLAIVACLVTAGPAAAAPVSTAAVAAGCKAVVRYARDSSGTCCATAVVRTASR